MKTYKLKKQGIALIAVLALCLTATIAIAVAASAEAGSADDPLVSKSYVDGKIAEVKQSNAAGTTQSGGAASTYKPISLEEGQTLLGKEGTEIILRSGEATAIDNGSNGISDLTEGIDLWTGNEVKTNHQLLVPRADGRGIKAKTIIWVMVRGGYEIK